ncbi:MAG: hypothetical protein KDA45_04905 [Planctomycetales bacterium]|nr:hypothetical protein [Planctomycetales bacterium]
MDEPNAARPSAEQGLSTRWLAYELHDGLLQWVVGARMQIDGILAKRAREAESDWVDMLRQVLNSLDSGLEEGRALIAFLDRESQPAAMSLAASLEEFVEAAAAEAEYKQQTLQLKLDTQSLPKLTDAERWNLLRIAQQGVRNAIQHAGPTSIELRLGVKTQAGRRELALEIHDQGAGFDTAQPRKGNHFGLSSMAHRAKLIAADFEIRSQPGGGCHVYCTLPLLVDTAAGDSRGVG